MRPLCILLAAGDEAEEVEDIVRTLTDTDFILRPYTVPHWNDDMTPWPSPAASRHGEPFGGDADAFLQTLLEKTESERLAASATALAGYSLGGLFALYAMHRCQAFSRIASVSGSLWYPGFAGFAAENPILRKPDRLYISLGDRESSARGIMGTVGERTREILDLYRRRGIDAVYEENPGNHFQDAAKRLAKGIASLLAE